MQQNPSKAMLDAWATDNVTIRDLIDVLNNAQLVRELELVHSLISEPHPITSELTQQQQTNLQAATAQESQFKYSTLLSCTNNFDARPLCTGGCLVGCGGSADVFRGKHAGQFIAVKRLKLSSNFTNTLTNHARSQFDNEVKILTTLKAHRNLLLFYGLCLDGPMLCLVYEYMSAGSLLDRLQSQPGCTALTPAQRLKISQDTATAITYLHSNNLIHRDVKSANILLSDGEEIIAKLGDYGITRQGPSNGLNTMTENIIGTTVYMPLEYICDHQISFLIDSYSFGVVLLELLTGLPPYDSCREEMNLVLHIEETVADIHDVVDARGGEWQRDSVDLVYDMAKRLLSKKIRRPLITAVLPEIECWH